VEQYFGGSINTVAALVAGSDFYPIHKEVEAREGKNRM